MANENGSTVAIYASDGSSPERTITDGVASPTSLAFDRSGNLYVANASYPYSTVTVYGRQRLYFPHAIE
ncbi:MAG TPA: hypothetical protein VGX91_11270 [Candidatus Cybelea sp.]|nr:hypothetical protein [Candidatus Cybelea sp.]